MIASTLPFGKIIGLGAYVLGDLVAYRGLDALSFTCGGSACMAGDKATTSPARKQYYKQIHKVIH